MNKKSIITIAGHVGSGKSSTADALAERLGYQRFSSGDFMRAIAEKRNVSIEELNILAQNDETIDRDIDAQNIEAGKKSDLVIDSRLAYHFIPESFKVFLTLDTNVAAERIWQHMQEKGRKSQSANSVEELIENTEKRYASEKQRYLQYYNLDVTDLSPFDLVIDTETLPLEHVVETIISAYTQWLED